MVSVSHYVHGESTLRVLIWSLIAASLIVTGSDATLAAVKTWTGNSNSDWSIGNNWSPSGAAGIGDSIVFPTAGINRTVNLAGNRSVVDLTFNSTNAYRLSNNQLTLTSGDLTSLLGGNHRIDSNVVIADEAAWNIASGTVQIYGAINTATPTSFGIDKSGAGALEFHNAGTTNSLKNFLHQSGTTEFYEGTYLLTSESFDAYSAMYMGDGTVTVSKRANIVGTPGGNLVLQSGGASGSNLVIKDEDTEVATFGQVFLGASGTAGNTVTVERDGRMRDIGLFVNGFNGNSSVVVRDAGTIETSAMTVGMLTGVTSTLSIQNSNSSLTTPFLALGGFNSAQKGGTGTVMVTDRGSLVVSGELRFFTSTSSLTVNNATATTSILTNEAGVTGSIRLRNLGSTAALTINSPAESVATWDGIISNDSSAGGIVKQGAGVQVFTKQQTYTGGTRIEAGTLTLGVANALSPTGPISAVGGLLNLGGTPQQAGVVTLQGGTIVGGATGILLPSSLALQSGTISTPTFTAGVVSKTTNGTATINAPLAASAINLNAGTLALNQGATAPVQVNAGMLNLKGNLIGNLTSAAGSSVIIGGATLVSGDTTLSGSLDVGSSTFVSDSSQPMIVSNMSLDGGTVVAESLEISEEFSGGGFINAPVTFGSLSTLKMELGGTIEGSEYDHLDISDLLSANGVLDVSLISGFEPTAGMSFDILDWNSIDGTFDAIQLPELDDLHWDLSQFYETGVLSVVETLGADFNLDGTVDGADLELWLTGFGTGTTHGAGDADGDGDVDGRDFLAWQQQFGGSLNPTPLADKVNAVPEPSSLILLLASASVLLSRRQPLAA